MGANVEMHALQYRNGYESDILANPALQYPKHDVVTDITKQVKNVIEVKNANYTPSSDQETGIYVGLVGVAAAIAGIVLCSLATAAMVSGFGAAAIVVGAAVTLLAIKLIKKAREKAGNEGKVEAVFDAAMHQGVGKTIQRYQDRAEGRGRVAEDMDDRRRDYRRDENAFVPHRAARRQEAVQQDDDAWRRIAE